MSNNFRNTRFRILALLLSAAIIAACATAAARPIEPGAWLMQSPDGTVEKIEVRLVRDGEYYLNAPGNPVGGLYRLRGDELAVTQPDNPRMQDLVWKLNADRSLTLVQEAPVQVSSRRLVSATLIKE